MHLPLSWKHLVSLKFSPLQQYTMALRPQRGQHQQAVVSQML